MAGIGFELRRMIDERDGFLHKVRAYACAGLISSGPWVMTILTLTIMSVGGSHAANREDFEMFRALVTYAFAFSLILTGVLQMSVTRRVADHLYAREYHRVLPGFTASAVLMGVTQVVIGTVFCALADFPTGLAFVAVSLYVIVSLTWLALVWLSITREFDEVLRAYAYGMLLTMVLLLLVGAGGFALNLLGAYTAGQALTLMLLIRTVARGMQAGGKRDWSILTSIKSFPRLVGIGLIYNVAIWIDKMTFWFVDGIGPHPYLRYHPLYDTCSFLAYLTVIPALAINLVRLETSFYERYRAYYGAILGEMPLRIIENKRREMMEDLAESTIRLLRVQGAISICFVLFAPQLMGWLEMPEVAVRIFRLSCVGAFFHVLLLVTVLMQLYFDLRWQALATSIVFLVLNGFLAAWSVAGGVATYGIGYAISSFLTLLLGYTLFSRGVDRLHFLTFTSQPIGGDDHMEAEEEVPADKKPDDDVDDASDESDQTEESEETEEQPAAESTELETVAQEIVEPTEEQLEEEPPDHAPEEPEVVLIDSDQEAPFQAGADTATDWVAEPVSETDVKMVFERDATQRESEPGDITDTECQ